MKTRSYSQSSDVIIIGGCVTGAGIARDCALRGLRVILVERHGHRTGATGGTTACSHSGARYAVTDAESARECISENQILKRIARHCVEPTNGLFITLPVTRASSRPLLFSRLRSARDQRRSYRPAASAHYRTCR